MAKLPDYVVMTTNGAGEEFDPAIVRSEMERGLAKQRKRDSRVVMQVACTLFFKSTADTVSFEDWYFDTIKRDGWFDWRNPRTRQVHSVRFVGGAIGKLTPLAAHYAVATRQATVEYLR